MNKNLLVIKPDHIGDYILFRNLFYEIKKSKKFENYNIYFFLNTRVKEIVEFLDKDILEYCFWIDLEKYVQNDWYCIRKNQEIKKIKFDSVINCMFSRFKTIENLIKVIKANNKVLIRGREPERLIVYKKEDENNYDVIIDISDKAIFEFDRLKLAIEEFINSEIILDKPVIEIKDSIVLPLKKEFILIFIGADVEYRKWNIYNYINLIENLLIKTDYDIVICGGNEEIEDGVIIENSIKSKRIHNIVGQTTLVDMIQISNEAFMTISNETGIAHISTILETKTLVISNGNHFGKFTPYPSDRYKNYYAVYPFSFDEKTKNNFIKKYYDSSSLDINSISLSNVLKVIDNILFLEGITKLDLKQTLLKKEKLDYLTNKQKNINYLFMLSYTNLFKNFEELKNLDKKYVLYGFGSIGKTIKLILGDKIVGIVDKSSEYIDPKPNSHTIYSPKNIDNFEYDNVIISVLGRENEILDYLLNNTNVKNENIIKFQISKGRYIGC